MPAVHDLSLFGQLSRVLLRKNAAKKQALSCQLQNSAMLYVFELVVSHPFLDLGLGQTLNVLSGVNGSFAANTVHEVQALGSLEQILLVAGGIAQLTTSVLLDQGSGLGVVLLLADDLLHGTNLLSESRNRMNVIIHILVWKSSTK